MLDYVLIVLGGCMQEPLMREAAPLHEILDRQSFRRYRLLGQQPETFGHLATGQLMNKLSVEHYRSTGRTVNARQSPQERRLTATVGANDGRD